MNRPVSLLMLTCYGPRPPSCGTNCLSMKVFPLRNGAMAGWIGLKDDEDSNNAFIMARLVQLIKAKMYSR